MTTEISDAAAAAAFRRLVKHLQHRHDAENIDLMGLAGFCRNCLADWVMEADNAGGGAMTKEEAREAIHGMRPTLGMEAAISERSDARKAVQDEGKHSQKCRCPLETTSESKQKFRELDYERRQCCRRPTASVD